MRQKFDSDSRRSTGAQGEETACRYLEGRGFRIIDRNWRGERFELDIVAMDGDTMVFCEVKTARTHRFGPAACWVTPRKVRRVSLAALDYIEAHDLAGKPFRFDVVGLDTKDGLYTVTHIPNAFSAPEDV